MRKRSCCFGRVTSYLHLINIHKVFFCLFFIFAVPGQVQLSLIKTDNEQIGRPGIVIKIAESKFGKRKNHRGKRVDGVWVFGGIERDSKRCFLKFENQSASTLIPTI